MAKKIKLENSTMDGFDLDSNLDIPDFNFDIEEPTDDRSPVKKILDSAVTQTKNTVASKGFIGKFLKEALPKSYGEIYDTASEVSSTTKELYNKAVKEIKPSISELTKSADKLIPATSKRTKAALDRIKEWSKKDESFSRTDEREIQEKNIALEIGSVFKFQMEEAQKEKAEEQAESRIQESLAILRHKQQFGAMGSIDVNIARLTKYQENITAAFQKKTLELQFRSYYLGIDALKEAKGSNEIIKTNLQGILKNTALPEFVKIKNSERFKEVARTKLMEKLTTTTGEFLEKALSNVGRMGNDALTSIKSGFETGTQMLDGTSLVGEMGVGPKKSFAETAAEFGIDIALQNMAGRLGASVSEKISKIEPVAKMGEQFRNALQNAPALITQFSRNHSADDTSAMTIARQLAGDAISGIGPNLSIETDNINSAIEPSIFTKQTNKSITEIIPGFLARIFRELQILRTGNEDISLTSYDYFSNKFTSSKALIGKIKDKVINSQTANWKESKEEELFSQLDPENKLSPAVRKKLLDKLIKDSISQKMLSRENLTNVSEYSSDSDLSASGQDISQLFEKYFTKDGALVDKTKAAYMKRTNDFSANIKNIAENLGNPSQDIQKLINLGLYDEVRGTGLFAEDSGTSSISDEAFAAIRDNDKIKDVLQKGDYRKAVKLLKELGHVVTEKQLKPREVGSYLSMDKIISSYGGDVPEQNTSSNNLEAAITTSGNVSSILGSNGLNQQSGLNQPTTSTQSIDSSLILQLLEEVKKINGSLAGVLNITPNDNSAIINAINSDVKFKPLQDVIEKIKEGVDITNVNLKDILEKLGNLNVNIGQNETNPTSFRRNTLFSNIKGTLSKGLDFGKTLTGVASKVGSKFFKSSAKAATNVRNVGSSLLKTTANILLQKRDVFVNGEIKPRLTKAGLEAGIYYDSVTNKIITSIKDLKNIKGSIFDNEGNEVLKLEELPNTFIKAFDSAAGSVVNLGKALFGTIGKVISFGAGASKNIASRGLNLVKSTYKTFTNYLDRPIDIFIKDKLDKVILSGLIMKGGGYFSSKTGKPVTKPSEIDGVIKNADGLIVLTEEQIKEGIVDKNNNPITTPGGKIIRTVLGVAGLGIKTAIRAGKAIGSGVMKGIGMGGDSLKGILSSIKNAFDFGMGGKKSNEVLVQIRDILDSRLPGSKNAFNDKDGDGDRDGGWQDIFQNNQSEPDKDNPDRERVDTTVKPERKNTIDRLIDGLGTIKDKIAGLFGFGGEDGSGPNIDIDLPDGDNNRSRRGGRRNARTGRGGFFRRNIGKVGSFISNNAGTLLKGAAGAGALYSGYNAVNDVASGDYGSAAINGGLAVASGAAAFGGLGALGSGVAAVGTGALAATSAIAGGVGALLASPVVLGAAAVAAVGYGGYRLYKALQNMKPFEKLRMAQYGFSKDNMSYVEKVKEFEDLLIKQVTYNDSGNAEISDKEIDYKRIESIFDLDFNSKDRADKIKINKWGAWFNRRFKPVFLTHLTALNKLDKKHTFDSIESEKDIEVKKKYLDIVKFSEGPYSFAVSPFESLEKLEVHKASVDFYTKEIYEELNKDDKKKLKDSVDKNFTTAALLSKELEKTGMGTVTKDGKENSTEANETLKQKISNLGIKDIISIIPGGAFAYAATTIVGSKIQKALGYGVEALEAIRFKAYGLKEMDRSKVLSLRTLEKEIDKGITFQSDSTANWKGAIPEVIENIGGEFGINISDSAKSEIWIKWFTLRFLPVYTAYVGELRQKTNKGDREKAEIGLLPQYGLDIAKTLIGLANVWNVRYSPWSEYELNTDTKTTSANLKLLEDLATDAKIAEKKKENKKTNTENKASGKQVADASKKLAQDQKSNYTDRRSEQQVTNSKIDTIMEANYGSNWKLTLSDADKKDSIATIEKTMLGKSQAEVDKNSNSTASEEPAKQTKLQKLEARRKERLTGKQPTKTPVVQKSDPVEQVKDAVPGNAKAVRSSFEGFGTEVDTYINEAANKYGIPEDILRGFVKMEGGWTGAMSPTGAIGTGQFIQSTWNNLAKTEEGKEIGMKPINGKNFRGENDPRRDKRINTLATGLLAKQNAALLERAGLPVNGENLYMVHNVGPGVIKTIKTGDASPETLKAMGHNGLGKHSNTAAGFVAKQKEIFNMHYASANAAPREVNTKILDEKGQWDDYADKSKVPTDTASKGMVPKTQSNTVQTEKTQPTYNAESVKPASVIKTSLASSASPAIIKTSGSYSQSVENTKNNPGRANETYASPLSVQKTPDMVNFAAGGKIQKAQDTSKELRDIVNPIGQTLKDSFSIQKDMLDALREIAGKLKPELFANNNSPIQNNTPNEPITNRGTPDRRLAEVPVSMSKTRQSF